MTTINPGDIIYCKKSFNLNKEYDIYSHIEGNSYTVFDCRTECIFIYAEYDSTPNGYLGFHVKNDLLDDFFDQWVNFSDYFICDKQKIRELKLNKINGNR